MRSFPVFRQRLLPVTFTLLLGYSAAAQNAPTPVTVPTGDEVLFGRHSARNCNSRKHPSQAVAQAGWLTPHARKIARRQYQDQHRDEFPSLYRPGVE